MHQLLSGQTNSLVTHDRYTASAQLCPKKYRPIVGWVVGWMNSEYQPPVAFLSATPDIVCQSLVRLRGFHLRSLV